jgi:conjugal transfer pilus assembly protein TraD
MGATWIHGLERREQSLYQPLQHTAGHTLIVGTTGAGKSRSFDLMITQAVLRGEAVIIIDPKGDKDLKNAAKRACVMAGFPERFVFFHPGFPEESARLNPLKHFSQPSELASRIAQIIPSVNGSDPFKSFGQKSLDNIIQGIVFLNGSPTLVELRRYLEGGPGQLLIDALKKHILTTYGETGLDQVLNGKQVGIEALATRLIRHYREYVQKGHPSQDLEGLISMFEHDRTHFGKMVASLLPVMNMLTTGELGQMLSPNIRDSRDTRPVVHSAGIINNAQVAYIGLDSLSDGMVGSALGSLLLADLASVAGKRYNYGVNNRPVNVFVDEAAEVINDPCIQLLNKGRGALIRMVIATQTFADFSARTGSDAKARQILANVNNLIALRILDSETQKYITDNLPLTRLRYIMRTQGVATQPNNPALFSGNLGERLMEEQGELFAPQLLGQLPDLHYIAKLSGGRMIKGRIPILTDAT